MAPETALPDFVDVNILPEQYRPRKLPGRVIIFSLVAVILAILSLALYLASAKMQSDAANLEDEILFVQNDLARVSTPAPEVQELMSTLAPSAITTPMSLLSILSPRPITESPSRGEPLTNPLWTPTPITSKRLTSSPV